MEDKISNNLFKTEKNPIPNERQVIKMEKNSNLKEIVLVKTENKDIETDKKESETKNTEQNIKTETKNQNNNEIVKNNDNKVLKRKVTEDGVIIERVLSEGETSSGFETVSSIDSKVDIDDLDLSSSIDDDEYNIIVKVKNELAFQYKNRPVESSPYHESSNKNLDWQNRRSHRYSNENSTSRRNTKDDKYWRNNVDKNYNYERRDRESTERKNNEHSRRRSSNNDRSSNRDRSSSKRGRRDEQDSRAKRSGSYDHNDRFKRSRSPDRVRNRNLNHKDTKTDTRSLRSFDRNSTKSSPERSSPPRKKRRETHTPKASSTSVWDRLNKRKSPVKKAENDKKNSRKSKSPRRKKERTPFLVELERKLKTIKNIQKETIESKEQVKATESVAETMQPPNESYHSYPVMNTTTVPYFQGAVYPTIPTVSINNLPLVPGPMGLPVHILPTGEQIPHDMDGRLIPVGPNGHYLPVDPSGRLFPHIVSPENQAVPVHLTEDGVLRLPNSEPVPYGPEHQLPVNIDGRVIPIGPDSKPLYPCPDLPRRSLVERVYNVREIQSATTLPPPIPSQAPPPPPPPQIGGQEMQAYTHTKTIETQTENRINIQPPIIDLCTSNGTQQIRKEDSLTKYNKKAQDKLKCVEKEKNFEENTSKGGVKRSIPVKLSRKKTAKQDTGNTSDMVLDSGDSNSPSKPEIQQSKEGAVDKIRVNSDDEQGALEIVCDNEVPDSENLETKFEDYITDKVKKAIKSLCEKNHKPPAIGRFIISDLNLHPSVYDSPNESPLWRNRPKLSFLTPNIPQKDQTITIKESNVNFKFLPQKNNSGEKNVKQSDVKLKKYIPVFSVDFAVQCDFTTDTIKNLNLKVSRLEMEISRLKRINSNLFNDYMSVQSAKQKKTEELRKALLEIQEKDKQIQSLKRF